MAVVIYGSYFLRRFASSFPSLDVNNHKDIAKGVMALAVYHLSARNSGAYSVYAVAEAIKRGWPETNDLYRIFFYDCPPLTKRLHFPVSGKSLVLANTPLAKSRVEILKELRRTRKVALRLGRLNEEFVTWKPKPDAIRRWIAKPADFAPIDDDFEIDVTQKGVDMRLGLDVASMAFKRQVDQIVLVAGDADFVPATKSARREGIDVVLNPMGGHAAPDLLDHVDGVTSFVVSAKQIEQV